MKSTLAALFAVLVFAVGAVWSVYLVKSDDYCPPLVEALFSPCKPSALTPAQLVAEDFQAIAQEHATTGAAIAKRQPH